MKKSERKAEIRKRAPEYARSGEFSGWLSIEHKLVAEGYLEARIELDNHYTKQELDSLCKIAQSPEETAMRQEFSQWIDMVVQEIGPQVRESNIKISASFHGNALLVNGRTYSLEFRRRFNSMQLEYSKAVDSKSGPRYRFGFENIPSDENYDSMTIEDIKNLILKLGDLSTSVAKQM